LKADLSDSQKLSPAALQFIDSVLALQPRVAVFDCDGTLWAGDSGADFFYWEIERGLVTPAVAGWALPRYKDYEAGLVNEETMCGEMVTLNAGIPERRLEEAAKEFFASVVQARIFPEMLQLTRRLTEAGCELWAVSSTNVWSVRAGVKQFGIPGERVLGACVEVENDLATNRLVRVPTGEGKAAVLRETLTVPLDACFGNSVHDVAMLEMARQAYAVNPNPDLEARARQKGWKVYWPNEIGSGQRVSGSSEQQSF